MARAREGAKEGIRMGTIYMRAGMSPLDQFDPAEVLLRNLIGTNVGNLIYAYGMFRILTTEQQNVIPSYYQTNLVDAERISETCDCFVIPLADAFRANFMPELRAMTRLIKKLKIPCVVTGVGLRAPFEPGDSLRFAFDEDVKAFVRAVLDKSALIGVRGVITSAYLTRLGFREGRDHTVIGCPSMYTFGRNITIQEPQLTPESNIAFNASVLAPPAVQAFLHRTTEKFANHFFLPQKLQELRLLYTGQPYRINPDCGPYPWQITDSVYREDRVRFFLHAPEWITFLKSMELSVGSRMHGNVAATLAGKPSILIPHDARMRELVEYHGMTHVMAKDIDEKTDIADLVSQLDFHQVSRQQGRNFDHFTTFLRQNGLRHIFESGDTAPAPLDEQLKGETCSTAVKSIRNCTLEEMAERWQRYYPEMSVRHEALAARARRAEEALRMIRQPVFLGKKLLERAKRLFGGK